MIRSRARTWRRVGLPAVAVALVALATISVVLPVGTGVRGGPRLSAVGGGRIADALSLVAPADRTGPVAPAASVLASPEWVNVTHAGRGQSPPQGSESAVVYDPADRTTVLFGGCLAAECPSNQTWTFSQGYWTNVTDPRDAPPARDLAAADYDANMGGVLLFGGHGVGGALLDDTWLYAGGHWTNLSYVGPAPSAREGATMAFDPDPEENGSVLFGGCIPSGFSLVCSNDTWVWAGWAGWVPLAPASPPPGVGFASATFDVALDDLVLFGGCAGVFCGSAENTTWELYSGQWWPTSTLTKPAARSSAAMVYDPTADAILMFGGASVSAGIYGDTWDFTAAGWSQLSLAPAPSPREWSALTLDSTGSTPIMVGGAGNTTDENDTWAFELAPSVSLAAGTSSAETTAPVTYTATVSGGTPPYALTVNYGDGTMDSITGSGPTLDWTHVFALRGTYTSSMNLTDAVGAGASATGPVLHVGAGVGVNASVAPIATDIGRPVEFTANASPAGTPPVTYAWTLGDGSNGTGPGVLHSYAAAGNYTASVEAIDADGSDAAATVRLTVVENPVVAPSFTPRSPNSTSVVAFVANESGGTPPFQYAWRFGDGAASAQPSPDHTFARAGSYSVQLWVNDSVGSSAYALLPISISGSEVPGPTPSGSSAPTWFWLGLGALVGVAVVGSVLLLRPKAPPGTR